MTSRKQTLNTLRENLKSVFAEFLQGQRITGHPTMRTKWAWAMGWYVSERLAHKPNLSALDKKLLKFITAGSTYYYAKKYGVQAATLAKLDGTIIDKSLDLV